MKDMNNTTRQEQYIPSPNTQPQWQSGFYQTGAPARDFQQNPYNNTEINKIRDWLPWSIVNFFIGWVVGGILPSIFSIICRNRKQDNDIHGAKTMSTLALVFNILITIGGLIGWILLIVLLVLFSKAVNNAINITNP